MTPHKEGDKVVVVIHTWPQPMLRIGTFVRYRGWYDGDICVIRYDGGFEGKIRPECVVPFDLAKALQKGSI